jgi:hypothetical protein
MRRDLAKLEAAKLNSQDVRYARDASFVLNLISPFSV